jgi:hypothetical protein
MTTLRDVLAAQVRTTGPIAPEAKDERNSAASFTYGGRAWTVDSDTRLERLHDLQRAMDSGRARIRPTRTGKRHALTDRADSKAHGLYVYSV